MKKLLPLLIIFFLFNGCATSSNNLKSIEKLDKIDKQVFKENNAKSWDDLFDDGEWIPVNKKKEI